MAKIVYKRGLAYLIDILIISLILITVQIITPIKSDVPEQMNRLYDSYLREETTENQFLSEFWQLNHQNDLENVYQNLLIISLIVIFFIIIPKIKEKTIGMMLVGIKIKSKKLSFKQLFIRSVVVNGLLYSIVGIILVYSFTGLNYFLILTFLGVIQIIIVIKSVFMVLLNKDHKGLQDIWSNSEIVFGEEEIK